MSDSPPRQMDDILKQLIQFEYTSRPAMTREEKTDTGTLYGVRNFADLTREALRLVPQAPKRPAATAKPSIRKA